MWRDSLFWTAVAAALPFWGALVLITEAQPHWGWPADAPLPFLFPALVYPVLEEIAFRGMLQRELYVRLPYRSFWGISSANIITSVIFSALHLLYHPLHWAAAVWVPSLVYGHLRDRYHKLTLPISLHIYHNTGYYWLFGG